MRTVLADGEPTVRGALRDPGDAGPRHAGGRRGRTRPRTLQRQVRLHAPDLVIVAWNLLVRRPSRCSRPCAAVRRVCASSSWAASGDALSRPDGRRRRLLQHGRRTRGRRRRPAERGPQAEVRRQGVCHERVERCSKRSPRGSTIHTPGPVVAACRHGARGGHLHPHPGAGCRRHRHALGDRLVPRSSQHQGGSSCRSVGTTGQPGPAGAAVSPSAWRARAHCTPGGRSASGRCSSSWPCSPSARCSAAA